MEPKTVDVVNIKEAKEKISDIEVVGNGDLWQFLCQTSSKSEGWMQTTRAMQVGNGCLVRVTTQQGNNVAEALQFVPKCLIVDDENGGRKLVPSL
jgi:hypothetical protein